MEDTKVSLGSQGRIRCKSKVPVNQRYIIYPSKLI